MAIGTAMDLWEYERQTPEGLLHQGLEDSWRCHFLHADGSAARGPIALR